MDWLHWYYVANFVIAIGTVLLAIGVPLSLWLAGNEERFTFYATLDKTYSEIQKLIIEKPHLAQPHPKGKTSDQLVQYDAFAFDVWNFIEAIYDYSKDKPELLKTWKCVIFYEANLHGVWFNKPENHKKFKKAFFDFVKKNDLVIGLPDHKGDEVDIKM
ncbi:MAG: hypothetical protein ABSC77_02090 [Terracidiphilus sp.]|jgi:hypothetical protein